MKVALIGFGDLGHYIRGLIMEFKKINENEFIYFDDNLYKKKSSNAYPFEEYLTKEFQFLDFYVCLGYKHLNLKGKIIDNLVNNGRKVPYFIHPTSYVHSSVTLGDASFIYPGCSIDSNTRIGKGVWIANADVIAHDCTIGDCCWFGASVTLSGKVSVAENTFIGSGTIISNDVHIASNVIIGVGSVITKNVQSDQSVIGNPMRVLDKPLKLI